MTNLESLLAELDEDAADCQRAALSLPGRAAAVIRRQQTFLRQKSAQIARLQAWVEERQRGTLERLKDLAIEDLMTTSDEEILAEAKEDGERAQEKLKQAFHAEPQRTIVDDALRRIASPAEARPQSHLIHRLRNEYPQEGSALPIAASLLMEEAADEIELLEDREARLRDSLAVEPSPKPSFVRISMERKFKEWSDKLQELYKLSGQHPEQREKIQAQAYILKEVLMDFRIAFPPGSDVRTTEVQK